MRRFGVERGVHYETSRRIEGGRAVPSVRWKQAAVVKDLERERIPLKRRGNPEEVARWIVSLADPASEWVTGQVITVDGGLSIS
jgi:NAD(P)-dependent dehydrogenase (short-subunit alcohol dehydrogenase family)